MQVPAHRSNDYQDDMTENMQTNELRTHVYNILMQTILERITLGLFKSEISNWFKLSTKSDQRTLFCLLSTRVALLSSVETFSIWETCRLFFLLLMGSIHSPSSFTWMAGLQHIDQHRNDLCVITDIDGYKIVLEKAAAEVTNPTRGVLFRMV